MTKATLPTSMKDTILQDAMKRDITTARRAALLQVLWNEPYLTRARLIARVELRLGKNCFGSSAWKDTFFRDMRLVKQALKQRGIDCYIAGIKNNLAITWMNNQHYYLKSNRF